MASASGNAALNQKLQNLQGPVLGPADLAQPLPLLKAQVGFEGWLRHALPPPPATDRPPVTRPGS